MEITLEHVERLKEKANVSYGRAKEVLTQTGGNLLDALIYLEEHGDIPIPEGTRYTTRTETPPPPPEPEPKATKRKVGLLTRLRWLLLDNELEIWRKGQPVTALPVLILILMLFYITWITIPLLLVGLLFGFRYRFSGPDLGKEDINHAFDVVADTAADLSRRVSQEFRSYNDRNRGTAYTAGPETQSDTTGEAEI